MYRYYAVTVPYFNLITGKLSPIWGGGEEGKWWGAVSKVRLLRWLVVSERG